MASLISSELEPFTAIPQEIEAEIEEKLLQLAEKFEKSPSPATMHVEYPLTWQQLKNVSKNLTRQHDNPILVLPSFPHKKIPEKCKSAIIFDDAKAGRYCQFTAQIVLIMTDVDNNTVYGLCKCTQKYKEKIHDGYFLKFPDENEVRGGIYRPELSFRMQRYAYKAIVNVGGEQKKVITLFSKKKLELGRDYLVRGLCWSAQDKKNSRAMPSQDVHVFVDYSQLSQEIMEYKDEFFEVFRGLKHGDFVNSCAFPFENSVSEYKELIFLALFSIRSATIPFNVLLVGPGGCTKSAFLKKISAVSGDIMLDSGTSTLKGLLPSFSLKNPAAGAMASARNFVIVNEFFEIIKQAGKVESSYEILSKMKNLLEGGLVPARSGNGSMDVKMRGATFMASNWMMLKGDIRLSTVNELYAKMDNALLDRLLIYPVPFKEQNMLVNQHVVPVAEKIKQFARKNKIPADEDIRILKKMPSPYPISTIALRTILSFKERLTPSFSVEVQEKLAECGQEIQAEYSYEKYTRALHFLSLISSAYAFERALSEGKLNESSEEVHISLNDIKNANAYYRLILARHTGREISQSLQKQEFLENSATPMQMCIFKTLKDAFEDPSKRSMLIEEVEYSFRKVYPEASWESAVLGLLKNKLLVWNEIRLMYLEPKLENEVVNALSMGGKVLALYERELSLHHLVEYSELEKKLVTDWKVGAFANSPPRESQKLVFEALSEETLTKEELMKKTGVDGNAIDYLHLVQKIIRTNDGRYSKKYNEV